MSSRLPAFQRLAQFKNALDADPTNVEVASRYWSALASFAGNDVRSGGYLIEALRQCALDSAGVIALARAYRELFDYANLQVFCDMAEEEGFEPPRPFRV
jgi:hypothetical protein